MVIRRCTALWTSVHAALAVAVMGAAGAAQAGQIDTGDSGIALRWDNTFRYNLGMRAEGRESDIYGNANFDESDARFGRGDIVTSRIDWLTEIEATYDTSWGRMGARVSGAAWYDPAYDSKVERNPAVTSAAGGLESSYVDGRYSHYTRKYYMHGGELLDAFVFANTSIGDMPFSVKAGRYSLYWGESFFFGNQGIAYSQQPIDGLKASTSPGIETKEVFLPQAQLSFSLQPTPTLTLAAQYYFEWDRSRFPEGGTYFGASDFLFNGPERFPLAPRGTAAALNMLPMCSATVTDDCRVTAVGFADSAMRASPLTPGSGNTGDFGVNARWNPPWAQGTIGFYYRKFDERQPWAGIDFPASQVAVATVGGQVVAIPTAYRLVYARNTSLLGVSYSRNIGSWSVAAEVAYRHDTALNNALPSSATGSSFGADGQGPRGNLLTGVVNGVLLLPSTPLFDTGTLTAELAWSHLIDVTENAQNYSGVGYAGCNPTGLVGGAAGDKRDGCSTENFIGAQVNLEPQWLQAFPGIDLSMPTSYFVGLHGNKQDNGDGFQGEQRYSLGVAMDIHQQYKVTLAYSDSTAHKGASQPWSSRDRGWVSLTVKTSF